MFAINQIINFPLREVFAKLFSKSDKAQNEILREKNNPLLSQRIIDSGCWDFGGRSDGDGFVIYRIFPGAGSENEGRILIRQEGENVCAVGGIVFAQLKALHFFRKKFDGQM